MEVRKRTILLAIFWGYIPLHSPYIGLINGRYLQFGFLGGFNHTMGFCEQKKREISDQHIG